MTDSQKITLGGVEFDIPQLPLGVMKKVWPITFRMSERAKAEAVANKGFEPTAEAIEDAIELNYLAISFIRPGFTRADLEAMTPDLEELVAGSIVIAIQAGGKRMGERMAMVKKLQEAATEQPPIGTASSPTSVSVPDGTGIMSSGQ